MDMRGSVTEMTENKSDRFFNAENESVLYRKCTECDLQISSSILYLSSKISFYFLKAI